MLVDHNVLNSKIVVRNKFYLLNIIYRYITCIVHTNDNEQFLPEYSDEKFIFCIFSLTKYFITLPF